MKIAAFADVHANFEGLQTISEQIDKWKPDITLVGGDIINRGPRPRECLDFTLRKIQSDGWQVIRGNHERYVISLGKEWRSYTKQELAYHLPIFWTYKQLDGDFTHIESLPEQSRILSPNGTEIRIVHASMEHDRAGIFPDTTDEDLRNKINPAPEVMIVGHTHRPLVRQIDQTLVINVGSAGLPFDRDQRLAYAQITCHNDEWQAKIIRVDYDLNKALRDFILTGFIEQSGPLTKIMMIVLQQAISLLYSWAKEYKANILDGYLSVEESVHLFLGNRSELFQRILE